SGISAESGAVRVQPQFSEAESRDGPVKASQCSGREADDAGRERGGVRDQLRWDDDGVWRARSGGSLPAESSADGGTAEPGAGSATDDCGDEGPDHRLSGAAVRFPRHLGSGDLGERFGICFGFADGADSVRTSVLRSAISDHERRLLNFLWFSFVLFGLEGVGSGKSALLNGLRVSQPFSISYIG